LIAQKIYLATAVAAFLYVVSPGPAFLAADVVLIFAAGLPAVRRFFLRHGVAVTRVVGVLFIAFGAKSVFDAASGALRRTG
jgi:threonine/homoserine/homoserine lactone efflux protein